MSIIEPSMENYEDDDDTHYCIKCHVTVTGLDNYVRHRQTGCQSEPKNEVMYPEILNADTFFNSLELRSSVKSKLSDAQGHDRERKTRSDDKKKKGKRCQEIEESTSKEKLMTLPPVVTDLDDPTGHIGIPSLVGFPDIVTFSEKSATVTSSKLTTPKIVEKKRSEDRVWLNDSILEDLEAKEAVSPGDVLDSEAEYDYRDEDSDESPDDDLQDSYTESEDEREYRAQAHTGGKWKPEQLLREITPPNDDELEQEDYRQDSPPLHTGGKWKPIEKAEEEDPVNMDEEEEDSDDDDEEDTRQPPPGHTRGKWVPGDSLVTAIPTADTGYWCTPCDRRLASKLVYNRHLRSDLHARRSIQEIEGDVLLPRTVGPLLRRKTLSQRQQVLTLKSSDKKKALSDEQQKTRRQREKLILRCDMCHSRVRRPQLGKHLLSHYHCRVAGLNPSSSMARRFILENMDNVVRQCPFQCTSCRFYCNTEDTFLLHWRSKLHASVENDTADNLTCVSCDFWCLTNKVMEEHLQSLEHREAVAMINGSVPVVIRKQRILTCETCNRHFRYNLQLRIHSRETGHPLSATATDDYQQRIACRHCTQVFRSLVALQRHQLTNHTSKDTGGQLPAPYFCSFCSINFETARDAVLHRRTTSHKQIVKERKFQGVETSQRDCGHCGERLRHLEELKLHLIQCHYDLCHSCSQCGTVFPLPQDLAKHTKKQECKEAVDRKLNFKIKKWNCTNCSLFSTDSQSEFIFHQVLHAGAVEENPDEPSSSRVMVKYRCLLCDKILPKETMRNHIRRHTGERPFSCSKCDKCFSRRSTLNVHVRGCLSAKLDHHEVKIRRRNYVCAECNEAFYTKHTLRQHMLRHAGKGYKCGFPGCPTVLRTENELKNHRILVHETGHNERNFTCNECSYAGKTRTQLRRHQEKHKIPVNQFHLTCPYKDCTFSTHLSSHLKRHIRVHTGTKPYKCRHCSYASNNLENLRKHVLSTRRHPGKMIYECETCGRSGMTYTTNFSKELRAHLVEAHPDIYPTGNHANDYVSSIFNINNDQD